jgi:tetratricopeptide (TPR) repeat protein
MSVSLKSHVVPMVIAATLSFAPTLSSQTTASEHIAAGDREYAARRAPAALSHYEAALDAAPGQYGAIWRVSRTLIDVAEFDSVASRRKAAFIRAGELARRAIELEPQRAEGYFHLSRALGREALSVSARERTKYALEVRKAALEALERDSLHAGALHVMGRWNAEVMRLNGITRMIARTFMGGKVFGEASWDEAKRLLELANKVEPDRTVHRLALGQVYRDTGERAKARAQFEAAIKAPLFDYNDEAYKREAAQELQRLDR